MSAKDTKRGTVKKAAVRGRRSSAHTKRDWRLRPNRSPPRAPRGTSGIESLMPSSGANSSTPLCGRPCRTMAHRTATAEPPPQRSDADPRRSRSRGPPASPGYGVSQCGKGDEQREKKKERKRRRRRRSEDRSGASRRRLRCGVKLGARCGAAGECACGALPRALALRCAEKTDKT